MRTDREELEGLRVSLARVARAAGVQTDDKPVLNKSINAVREMAMNDHGWSALAGLICEEIGWLKHELKRYRDECE